LSFGGACGSGTSVSHSHLHLSEVIVQEMGQIGHYKKGVSCSPDDIL